MKDIKDKKQNSPEKTMKINQKSFEKTITTKKNMKINENQQKDNKKQ